MYQLYLSVIIPLTALFPLITALLWFRDVNTPGRIIFWFVLVSAIINQVMIFASHYSNNTLYFYHIYAVLEFGLLSAFYSCFFDQPYKRIIGIIAFLFLIACIVNVCYFQSSKEFNSYTRTLGALIITFYAVLVGYRQNNKIGKWASDSTNWFNTGILLYYACSAMLFAFTNYLLRMPVIIFKLIWGSQCAILAIEYIFFAIGYYKINAANAR